MKKVLLTALVITLAAFGFESCRSFSGALSENAHIAPRTSVTSFNEYDLNVSGQSVTYTIDISTTDGASKLKGLSLKEAQNLALTEAVMKNNCAMLINPQYTHLNKGKRILRITVFGFPAYYKNQPKPAYDKRERYEIEVK